MAGKVYEKHQNDGQIGIKKLFYVVRPLFCCEWILKNGSMPPTEFQRLIDEELASSKIISEIVDIRQQKESALEGQLISIPQNLKSWISDQLKRVEIEAMSLPGALKRDWGVLDQMLIQRVI